MITKSIKQNLRQIVSSLGYEVRKTSNNGGLISYLQPSKKEGVDVNEWIETKLGWPASLPILNSVVFPYLQEDSVVCELGPGTGRQSRYLINHPHVKKIYLIDNQQWIVNFLKSYFSDSSDFEVYFCDGYSLPIKSSEVDLIFSEGCFIALKLNDFLGYAKEFYRILKSGGYCIFNYLDAGTEEGFQHLIDWHSKNSCFTYQSAEAVDQIFQSVGFEVIERHQLDSNKYATYLVSRKPLD